MISTPIVLKKYQSVWVIISVSTVKNSGSKAQKLMYITGNTAVKQDLTMCNALLLNKSCNLYTFRIHSLFKALVISTGLACLSSFPRHFTLTTGWTNVLNMPCKTAAMICEEGYQ